MVELSQLGAIIKTAYEAEPDTNAFTDAEKNKLASFASEVRSTVLSGLSLATNAAITALDTVLISLGKLQAQITSLGSGKQDFLVSGLNIKSVEGVSLLGSGDIDISKSSVGLANVDNTSDINKPVSTAQATALSGKENSIASGTISQYWRGDKTFQPLDKAAVGLANVDNTSDINKPVSTSQESNAIIKALVFG
jgi:hypothetical protein